MVRIGTKKLAFEFELNKINNKWHKRKYTITIWRVRWDEHEQAWCSNWWKHINFGFKNK